jgi:hypothetical protein
MTYPLPSPPPQGGRESAFPSPLWGGARGGASPPHERRSVRGSAFAALAAGIGLASCTSGALQPATPIAVDAGRAASLVSSYRAQNGLGPVTVDTRLMRAAADMAMAMGQRDRMGHRVGGSLARRLSAAGYDWGATAENLGAGYQSLDAAMAGWKASSGHRKNLLNSYATEIGIAAVATPAGSKKRTYWAMILAAPRPEPGPGGPFVVEAVQ